MKKFRNKLTHYAYRYNKDYSPIHPMKKMDLVFIYREAQLNIQWYFYM
jgi:hypothetical protein